MIYISIYLYGTIIFLSFCLLKIKYKFKNDKNNIRTKLYEKIDSIEDRMLIEMIGHKNFIFLGSFALSLFWPFVILVLLHKLIIDKKENR